MRVALISEYQSIGGGESNLMNLCIELAKTAEVVLFCDGALYEHATARGIQCRRYRLSGRRWFRFLPVPGFSPTLLRELKAFDVIHAYSLNILPRLAFLSRPTVWTTHGFWERPFGLRARVIGLMVDRVITVSSDVDAVADFPSGRKRKIYLGAPLAAAAAEKPFTSQDVRIACVGRFQHIKGQDLLVKAIGRIAAARPQSRIAVDFVGDVNGGQEADIAFKDAVLKSAQRHAAPNLSIRFVGFQKDTGAFIRQADLVVVPSRYESFSMVAIEALGCGKPVVAPDIGGPKDIVNSAGVGVLFAPGDATALERAVCEAIDDFARFSGAACMRRAADFSIRRQAEGHLQLYREICGA